MSDGPPITLDDLPEAAFPPVFTGSPRARVHHVEELITEWGELTEEHVQAVQAHLDAGSPTLGVETPSLGKLRHNHHRMAQLLAQGVEAVEVARICGFSPTRVYMLKSDPAFQELLAHYAAQRDARFENVVEKAAYLSEDLLAELQQRLNDSPEQFTAGTLTEAFKVVADRAGFAPVNKSVNLNVNAEMGTRLHAARLRAAEAERRKLESDAA